MWCTEVAAGAFLIFYIVVSGDIAERGDSVIDVPFRLRARAPFH
jgi:hypothetical protein